MRNTNQLINQSAHIGGTCRCGKPSCDSMTTFVSCRKCCKDERDVSSNYSNFSWGLSHQSRLDCAAEVNYPACLIQEKAGDDVCEVAVSPQIADLYNKCLVIKRKNAEANMCSGPGETHDGYGNCIKVQGQPSPPVCYSDGITEKCYTSPVFTNRDDYILHLETEPTLAPQERTPLQQTGDLLSKWQDEIGRKITSKPNPPCGISKEGAMCRQRYINRLEKSKDIVKWGAIGLAAYLILK